jgi:PAS domain S-box-containing protein
MHVGAAEDAMPHDGRATERASQAPERLDVALSLVDDAIVWTDAELVVQWCNASFDRLVGLPHVEILGSQIDDILPLERAGELVAHAESPFDRADGGGSDDFYELHARKLEVRVRRTARPEETVVASIRDVTERARIEDTNRELYLRLEATNRELESFAYSASHDLRAPLRSIDGFSQALLEDYGDQLPEKGRDYLRRVRAAAQRMAQLIDDLLRLSRVTRGDLHPEHIDLTALARAITQELAQTDPARRVEVVVESGLEVEADARLLRILLENLLGNAWKFTSRIQVARIEVGAREVDGERAIFVRDNGAGFDMARADKLFAPFQRLHAAGDFPGTGIGLATAQRIVHRHGGRIWAVGEVDHGATVSFTLGAREAP